MYIPFNKPYLSGKETEYIKEAVASGKISGDGMFTKKCHQFFQQRYRFARTFLTTSCTAALEMAAILCDIRPGDEVIAPSYTFVSTVNAFVLRGARIVFADSEADTPNMDVSLIEPLVTRKTKAVVPVHYAGIACDMDPLLSVAGKHGLYVVEDAAQAIDSGYKGVPLGSLGDLGALSFHETKNIISGEGGMLVVNRGDFIHRAEIIREKGTNRAAFYRGEVDKYSWVDIGSSFLPSDIIAAFLYAQLEKLDAIQSRRKAAWQRYYAGLKHLEEKGHIKLPVIPEYAGNNGHMFFILCESLETRSKLIGHLKNREILAVFHYLPLHCSPYYSNRHDGRPLPNARRHSDCLLRLPLYYELTENEQDRIIEAVNHFYG
jgi:dTDP-4-amino-4,6-dideoxygalactose transaminase